MVLARALQQRGLRVHVVDANNHTYADDTVFTEWSQRIRHRNPDNAHPIRLTVARDTQALQAVLDEKSHGECIPQSDVVLVDTMQQLNDRTVLALKAADLVLAPFKSDLEARWVSKKLADTIIEPMPIRSMFFDYIVHTPNDRNNSRERMRNYPLLENEVPDDSDLLTALLNGEIPSSASGSVEDAGKWQNWSAIEALAYEVMDPRTA